MIQPAAPVNQGTSRRPGWLVPVLVVLLIAVPLVEVWVLIQVGRTIGVGWTLLILVVEAAFGAWLLRREGRRAWSGLQTAFGSGKLPAGELANAALVLVGGVLLMFPGFVTDVFGLFFLLPFTRPLARWLLGLAVAGRVRRAGVDVDLIRAQVDQRNNIRGESVQSDGPESASGPDTQGPDTQGPDPSDDGSGTIIRGEIEP